MPPGLMLLMFGVGLHFSLDDWLAVRRIALPGAIAQLGARLPTRRVSYAEPPLKLG
jgi:predicted Kef-type K+ transport protein